MTDAGLRALTLVLVAGVAATAAALPALLRDDPPAAPPPRVESAPKRLALYCQFYVFVESRPFVAFMMEKSSEDPALYKQVYVAKADGDRTDYNELVGRRPEWRLDLQANPPRLSSRVSVPDTSQAGLGEQDIAIELRDFDARTASESWREASLKSVYYQNLPGKCRQTASQEPVSAPG